MIYLDNAATTPMLPEVITTMTASMKENYGNPSSTHQSGRKAKVAIEKVRKSIAKKLNVTANEIIFTSGATEGNNFVLRNAVQNLEVKHIVTSRLEHYAVLKVITYLQQVYDIHVTYLDVDAKGVVCLNHLETVLSKIKEKTLVSLMMVNNEIGNILPVKQVSRICRSYDALFHSDSVQAVGKLSIDLKESPIDFFTASSHKFHGPKGVGFVYVKKINGIRPNIIGGGQEKGLRSGTENVNAIVGMGKALDITLDTMSKSVNTQRMLKKYLKERLSNVFEGVAYNGLSSDLEKSACHILSVRFPKTYGLLLFNLDLQGIAVSGGSACQSGASKGSHVLAAILDEELLNKTSVRFSFSTLTTKEDLDSVLAVLTNLNLT